MLIAKGQLRAAGDQTLLCRTFPPEVSGAGGLGGRDRRGRASVKGWSRGKGGAGNGCIVGPGVPSMGKVMFTLKETSWNCWGGEGPVGGCGQS